MLSYFLGLLSGLLLVGGFVAVVGLRHRGVLRDLAAQEQESRYEHDRANADDYLRANGYRIYDPDRHSGAVPFGPGSVPDNGRGGSRVGLHGDSGPSDLPGNGVGRGPGPSGSGGVDRDAFGRPSRRGPTRPSDGGSRRSGDAPRGAPGGPTPSPVDEAATDLLRRWQER